MTFLYCAIPKFLFMQKNVFHITQFRSKKISELCNPQVKKNSYYIIQKKIIKNNFQIT